MTILVLTVVARNVAFHFLFRLLVDVVLALGAFMQIALYVVHNLSCAPFFLHHLAYFVLETGILLMHHVHLVQVAFAFLCCPKCTLRFTDSLLFALEFV